MKVKLFPRNLTAQAAHLVRGNPAVSRPESGTDVCTPGLEIDLRTLEERFFPGLVWDFERPDAAKLIEMDESVQGLKRRVCLQPKVGVYLWAIYGRVYQNDTEPAFVGFEASGGRTAWRRIRDLAKGRVAILFGAGLDKASKPKREDVHKLLLAAYENSGTATIKKIDRRFAWAVMAADRRSYLDAGTGVIVDPYQPGELTKGLCAPWQFDFRDCACNYWAAAKPDMVKSPDPAIEYVSFNRNRTKFQDERDSPSLDTRAEKMYSEAQMVAGAWKAFPTVVGDIESNEQLPPMTADGEALFTRAQVGEELGYLATVEHTLIVEYLYAAYSVDPSVQAGRDAASVVRLIAVDEMRHFLWVNELLQILGYAPSIGRATVIGGDPARTTGVCLRRRLDRSYLHLESRLCPLTLATLDYFIDVEKNSRTLNGLYSHIYASVVGNPGAFPEATRLLPILRLIIDEGEEHFQRLTAARALLVDHGAGEWWLRPGQTQRPASRNKSYLDAANYYHLLLDVISLAFRLDDGGPLLLAMAKDIMREMDGAIQAAMAEGTVFDWPLPDRRSSGSTIAQSLVRLNNRAGKIRRPSSKVRALVAEAALVARREAPSLPEPAKCCTECVYVDPERRKC